MPCAAAKFSRDSVRSIAESADSRLESNNCLHKIGIGAPVGLAVGLIDLVQARPQHSGEIAPPIVLSTRMLGVRFYHPMSAAL